MVFLLSEKEKATLINKKLCEGKITLGKVHVYESQWFNHLNKLV